MILPDTDDPAYVSLETLLAHVFKAARGYLVWMCDTLDLPNPEVDTVPPSASIEANVQAYLEHLLERWRSPLADVSADRFYGAGFPASWNASYCGDSMLEHAVMHPLRHEFQLTNLLEEWRDSPQAG